MTALVLAAFPDEGAFLRARVRLIAAERRVVGEWLPYASDALGDGAGAERIRPVAVAAGIAGALALFALETWSAVWAYPVVEGARPLFSWQAFIPSAAEFGALAAAVGGVIAFFVNGRLTRLHAPAFDFGEIARGTLDAFVLGVACDAGDDVNAVVALLGAVGADQVRVVTA